MHRQTLCYSAWRWPCSLLCWFHEWRERQRDVEGVPGVPHTHWSRVSVMSESLSVSMSVVKVSGHLQGSKPTCHVTASIRPPYNHTPRPYNHTPRCTVQQATMLPITFTTLTGTSDPDKGSRTRNHKNLGWKNEGWSSREIQKETRIILTLEWRLIFQKKWIWPPLCTVQILPNYCRMENFLKQKRTEKRKNQRRFSDVNVNWMYTDRIVLECLLLQLQTAHRLNTITPSTEIKSVTACATHVYCIYPSEGRIVLYCSMRP